MVQRTEEWGRGGLGTPLSLWVAGGHAGGVLNPVSHHKIPIITLRAMKPELPVYIHPIPPRKNLVVLFAWTFALQPFSLQIANTVVLLYLLSVQVVSPCK